MVASPFLCLYGCSDSLTGNLSMNEKEKSNNDLEKERQECIRKLKEMGFDSNNMRTDGVVDDDRDIELEFIETYGSIGKAIFILRDLLDSPQALLNEDVCKLTLEEEGLFAELPRWHRDVFMNFPGCWKVTKDFNEHLPNVNEGFLNEVVNKLLIKESLRMVIDGDEVACYIWRSFADCKNINIISNEMEAWEISALMFPLIAYQDYSDYFEKKLLRFFNKDRISLAELRDTIALSGYFEDFGVLVVHVWGKYLDDKAEYLELYNQSVLNKISNSDNKENKPDIDCKRSDRKPTKKTLERYQRWYERFQFLKSQAIDGVSDNTLYAQIAEGERKDVSTIRKGVEQIIKNLRKSSEISENS